MNTAPVRFGLVALALIFAAACGDDTPPAHPDLGVDLLKPDAKQCGVGTTLCGGKCVKTDSDNDNCGACGDKCKVGQVCGAGSCGLYCPSGQKKCGGEIGRASCRERV